MSNSRNYALANAARKVRALNERLPEEHQVDLGDEWGDLVDALDGLSDWAAHRVIEDWTESMEMRLCGTLLHAPLDTEGPS